MNENRRVGVVMGGWGEEREVSIKSGEAVARSLEAQGHDVTRVLAGPGLPKALAAARIDVAFLALHGRMGEDGRVQGLLEVMGIPYTGSGVLASALAMNKPVAKKLLRQHNLATPTGYTVRAEDLAALDERHVDLGFPCVVKPARGGSSVGISFVQQPQQLLPAVAEACRYGGEALVERLVKGKEVTVAVLDGEVMGTCEVAHGGAVFDVGAKYSGTVRTHLPARLSATRLANVEALALSAVLALGCRGAARVDFICSDTDNDVVLEVNTLPGLTAQSLYPRIARAAGLPFDALVARLLALATLDGAEVGEPAGQAPPAEAALRVG